MPGNSHLYLFNHARDAWNWRLRDWLQTRSSATLQGEMTWLVCGSYVQASWIRRCALAERISLFGIHCLDLRRLRQRLCQHSGLPSPSFGRETLVVLLQAHLGPELERSGLPDQILSGFDELASSGWLAANGLAEAFRILQVPDALHGVMRQLAGSLYWRPAVDRALAERPPQLPNTHLTCFGLDLASIAQTDLLAAAAGATADSQFWVAQPFLAETRALEWINALEHRLGAQHQICPTGDTPRPFEPIAGEFVYRSEVAAQLPMMIKCDRRSDQTQAVADQVQKALELGFRNVAIAVPPGSDSGPLFLRALLQRGLPVADEIRPNAPPSLATVVQRWLAEWVGGERTADALLRLADLLFVSRPQYKVFRQHLLERFGKLQTRSPQYLFAGDDRYPWIEGLLALPSDWAGRAAWSELSERWEAVLFSFERIRQDAKGLFSDPQISFQDLQPNWAEMTEFLGATPISGSLFLRHLRQSLAKPTRAPFPGSAHRYAPIVLSTIDQLQATSWDYLILPDAIGQKWRSAKLRYSLLSEEFRQSAIQQGYLLMDAAALALWQDDQVLQLLLQAQHGAAVVAYEEEENQQQVRTNDFMVLLQACLHGAPLRYVGREESPSPFKTLARVAAERRNRATPFGEHSLNFQTLRLPRRSWNPSQFNRAVKAPGSLAFKLVFGTERTWPDDDLRRDARKTLGTLVHRTLQHFYGRNAGREASEKKDRKFVDATSLPPVAGVRAALHEVLQQSTPDPMLTELLNQPWWGSLRAKALTLCATMIEHLEPRLRRHPWLQAEAELEGVVLLAGQQLCLRGRVDLLLSDRPEPADARLRVVDFKTAVSRNYRDDELQLAGYQLLAELEEPAEVGLLVVNPERAKKLDEPKVAEAKQVLSEVAAMQRLHAFGLGAMTWAAYGIKEALPIATVPIPLATLQAKRELTLKP